MLFLPELLALGEALDRSHQVRRDVLNRFFAFRVVDVDVDEDLFVCRKDVLRK